jgi:hypothetical protein
MSFPLIRPEDVPRLPSRALQRLRLRLAEECAAAAVRHDTILLARLAAPTDPEWATSARLTELERCAAEVPVADVGALGLPVRRGADGRYARCIPATERRIA